MARKRRYKTNTGDSAKFEEEKQPEPIVEEKPLEKNYKVESIGGLRIRKNPSQDDETLTIVRNGTLLAIDKLNESETWGHVIMAEGRFYGWVMMKFVKKL